MALALLQLVGIHFDICKGTHTGRSVHYMRMRNPRTPIAQAWFVTKAWYSLHEPVSDALEAQEIQAVIGIKQSRV